MSKAIDPFYKKLVPLTPVFIWLLFWYFTPMPFQVFSISGVLALAIATTLAWRNSNPKAKQLGRLGWLVISFAFASFSIASVLVNTGADVHPSFSIVLLAIWYLFPTLTFFGVVCVLVAVIRMACSQRLKAASVVDKNGNEF